MKTNTKRVSWLRATIAYISMLLLIVAILPNQAIAGKYRTIEAHLKHQTADLSQVKNDKGILCGCAATAWVIVFDYWKQYKGKERLLTDGSKDEIMNNLAEILGRTYGTFRGKQWGRTLPKKMKRACKYVKKFHYKCSIKRVKGSEFKKFWEVKKALERDEPVIILLNNPKKTFTSLHYAIIEKAELKQKKVLGKWRNRDVRYWVNMHDGVHKWIWVREVGRNTHPHTGSFSMFFLKIK